MACHRSMSRARATSARRRSDVVFGLPPTHSQRMNGTMIYAKRDLRRASQRHRIGVLRERKGQSSRVNLSWTAKRVALSTRVFSHMTRRDEAAQ